MSDIYCSRQLHRFLGSVPKESRAKHNRWDWNAHTFFIRRKRFIIFLHPETVYVFGLSAVLKKDLPQIHDLFKQGFIHSLYANGILDESEESRIRASLGGVHFLPTNGDRSTIGFLNDAIYRTSWWWKEEKSPVAFEKACNYLRCSVNQVPIRRKIWKGYRYPREMMREKLDRILDE